MTTKSEVMREMFSVSDILDIIDGRGELNHNDLEGVLGAIVMRIIRETNQLNKAKLEEAFERIDASGAAEHQVGEDYRRGFAEGLDQAVFMIRELMASA